MLLQALYRDKILELKTVGIETAELDARVLICHCLDISIEKFFLMQNEEISKVQIKKIDLMIKKRTQNMPVAYLTGHKEFFGLDFVVNKNVLIPRPETEWIVDEAIKFVKSKVHKVRILDMGTGCGNIIIAIAKNCDANFTASDILSDALAVAQKNAKMHGVDNQIKFIKSDLFENLKNTKFDIIIANLPYVPMSDSRSLSFQPIRHTQGKLQPESSILFEPRDAIFTLDNGAEIIKLFLKAAPNYLNDDGIILIELDPRNAIDIKNSATKYFPQTKIKLGKDLAGFNRYLIIEKSHPELEWRK